MRTAPCAYPTRPLVVPEAQRSAKFKVPGQEARYGGLQCLDTDKCGFFFVDPILREACRERMVCRMMFQKPIWYCVSGAECVAELALSVKCVLNLALRGYAYVIEEDIVRYQQAGPNYCRGTAPPGAAGEHLSS